MSNPLQGLRNSVSVKALFIGVLVLILLAPMSMIEMLIHERRSTADSAARDIMQSFGHAQTIAGPLLMVPYRYPVHGKEGKTTWYRSTLLVSPRELNVSGTLAPEIRYRGLHRLPVYTADLHFSGAFSQLAIDEHLPPGGVPMWEAAAVALSVSDPRPIKARMVLEVSGSESVFEPGGVLVKDLPGFLIAPLADFGPQIRELDFRFQLMLAGSDRLSFLPMGDSTRVDITSSWSSPSFDGAYLPDARSIDDQGFRARWKVLNLGRGFPSAWRAPEVSASDLYASAFGVRLYEPASVYQQATRAAKYAVLFIVFTFLVYFMMEIFAARTLHPFQYLLVGFANCMFYLLLVSLSEHISFAWSYLMAAAACSLLISGYSLSVLGSAARAAVVLAVMSALYAFLFVVLRSEDHALLMGSVALFVALAIVMYLTRRIDWYGLSLGLPGNAVRSG